MCGIKTASIFAALAFASGVAVAAGPRLPAADPGRGSLAISVEATPPIRIGRMPAVQVYLVNLDRDPEPSNAESVMQSKQLFEFTQWTQIDDPTWKETRDLIEQAKQAAPNEQQ